MNIGMVLVLLIALILLGTMVYGPLAAALVEMFPTRIRYTALSVPYHVGVGWIGGLLPAAAFSLVVATGNIYYGLWYPVLIASLSFLIGLRYVQETKGRDINAE
jgi:hypothetical protein